MKLRRKENTKDIKKFIIRVGAQNMRESDREKRISLKEINKIGKL